MNEPYGAAVGERVPDAEWIREAAGRGECILSKDVAVARRPLEAEAIYFSSAKVFVLTSAAITGEQMATRIARHQSGIERWARRVPGSFVCGIYEGGLRRLQLRVP